MHDKKSWHVAVENDVYWLCGIILILRKQNPINANGGRDEQNKANR
jgi:hypothetical protein